MSDLETYRGLYRYTSLRIFNVYTDRHLQRMYRQTHNIFMDKNCRVSLCQQNLCVPSPAKLECS